MRSGNMSAIRQLRRASSRISHSESTLPRSLQQPTVSLSTTQCASASTSTTKSPSSAPARKFVPRTSAKPFAATAPKAAPAKRHTNPVRESPSIMTVDDVDPSLGPLPSVPVPAKSSSSSTQTTKPETFSETLQTPGYVNPDPASDTSIDWSSSFHGLSTIAFEPHVASILMAPLDPEDIEMKPDGIAYLPEIKYRRILNQAFGPGGWGLAPRGDLSVGEKVVTREYALVVGGRFVAQARGECGYFSDDTIPTAAEGCKSNALSRCCKDLGIASELWDPRYLRTFKKKHCHEVWVEHVVNKKKRQIWTRKDADPAYPYVVAKPTSHSGGVKKVEGGVRDADGFLRRG